MNMLSEQERAARMATIARSESKVFFRKKLLPFAVVMSVLFTTLLWWNSLPERPTPVAEVEKPRVAEQKVPAVQQPQVVQAEVSWVNKSPDGTLPVGEWSQWINVGVGCKLDFFLNEEMKAEWLDYNNKPHDLVVGQHLSNVMSIRFKPMVPGKTRYPYRLTC